MNMVTTGLAWRDPRQRPPVTGRTRSDVVREALRRQLSLLRFEQLRRQVLPFAEARGYLTDEDVARDVS
jgi:hypothetical protein